jgi:hypothetical protein
MNGLKRRVERLEQQAGMKQRQMICFGPNLEDDDEEETPWTIKIRPGEWATAFGAPFTSAQIERLRAEGKRENEQHEPQKKD